MTDELLVSDVLAGKPSLWRMLGRALCRHCPRCGTGGLFHRWLGRVEHCGGCGYKMEGRNDFFFGAYLLNLCVTLASLFFVLISCVAFEAMQRTPPMIPMISIGLFCALILPLLFYPYSFTLWAVIDLQSEPLELAEIAGALDNLDADRVQAESPATHSRC